MKAKSITKRILSIVLVAVMLVSCWVFTAPDAYANQTDYKYSVWVQVDFTKSEGLSNKTYVDLSWEGGSERLFSASNNVSYGDQNYYRELSGFPTGISANKVMYGWFGNGRWTITLHIFNYNTGAYQSLCSFSQDVTGNGNHYGSASVSDNQKPYAASIAGINGSDTLTLNPDGSAVSESYSPGPVRDQYGYNINGATATLTSDNAGGTSFTSNTLSGDANCNRSNDYPVTLTATYGSLTTTKTVTIGTFDYTVNFKSEDGSSTYTNNVTSFDYDAQIAYGGSTPTKTATAQYTYTHDGWSATIGGGTVTLPTATGASPKTYYAHFSASLRSYNITFAYKKASNDNTSLVDASIVRQNVNYGVTPTAPTAVDTVTDAANQIPRVIVTAATTYTFTGWDTEVSSVTGTKTYNAVYTSSRTPYNITFKWVNPSDVGGALLEQTTAVGHGLTPSTPDNTLQDGIPNYEDNVGTWTFDYWNPEVTSVSAAATYIAQYRVSRYNNYTITFHDVANGQDSVSTLHWNDTITVPEAAKAADAQYTYTFSHWVAGTDVTGPAVTPASKVAGNAEYTAVYSTTVNQYTITYKRTLQDGNGTVTDIKTTAAYDYGTVPSSITGTDAIPNLADYPWRPDDTNHYVAGWTNEQSKTLDEGILGNTVFTITYTPVEHTWVSEEGVVTKVATCTETGTRVKTCSVCSKSVESTIAIDPTNHDPVLHTVTPDEMSFDDVYSGASSTGYVYFQCTRCSNVWAAEYNDTDKEYDVKDFESNPTGTPESNIDEIVSTSEEIPAPSFNMYYDDGGIYDTEASSAVYDYAFRGASLRKMDTGYEDGNTLQDIRFSGSVSIPEGVSTRASAYNKLNKDSALVDNVIIDFGFVYTQDSYMGRNPANLTLDNVRDDPKYLSMSVVDNNAGNGTYDVATDNWVGVTYHAADDSGYNPVDNLTFNLVISVKAKNWNKLYAGRPYIQYKYHGQIYTVYDIGATQYIEGKTYSRGSVFGIGGLIALCGGSYGESQGMIDYCRTRIAIPKVNTYGSEGTFEEEQDWWLVNGEQYKSEGYKDYEAVYNAVKALNG